ncbi:TIM barrel protein [Lucifera butyrica]|nr:TIM barrel protein [Lucifera butyrica]
MSTVALFGPAGNPDAFYNAGFKASVHMPAWLAGQKLGAYEYQCSRGVHIGEETARMLGEKAAEYDVKLSIHAPYYISLATEDELIAANTTNHFLKSLEAARWMGADRIVFHIGGPGKLERANAMQRVRERFARILEEAERRSLTGVYLAPETMGKQNQLGTLPEVLSLCSLSSRVIPALDFGHLHAVSGGRYTTFEEYETVFNQVEEQLGTAVAANVHIHFSKIEFTKAGEKRHWTFKDPFGPPHEALLQLIAAKHYTPRVICESAGTQAEDAAVMQTYYLSRLEER